MKTMLGGWEDVQRLLASERAARPGSAAPPPSVSVQRCVALPPQEGTSQGRSGYRFSLRETRVGGVSVPLPPLPAAERWAPRHATRPQALTRPVPRPTAGGGGHGAARVALDDTCQIQDVDFLLLMQRPAPPQSAPAPHLAAGLRRGGTSIEPALRVVPPAPRCETRSVRSLLQSLVRRAKALLGWLR